MEDTKMDDFKNIWYADEGYSIAVSLSQFNRDEKYRGYSASCQYKYNKKEKKYSLSMWLKHSTMDQKYHVEYDGIDTQYISGTRETIRENICRIVKVMMEQSFFDYFIDRYEYDMKCCEKGAEILDAEGMTA